MTIARTIIRTADICDDYPEARVCELQFHDFSEREDFHGEAVTFATFEDNRGLRDILSGGGNGKVLIVDGRGSMRRALCGGNIADMAFEHGWAGMIYGLGGACGILLLAKLFAPVRDHEFMTMSEEISYYVGAHPVVKNTIAVFIFVASIGWLGAHILGGGMYLAWLTGLSPFSAKLLIALGFSVYVVIGGYVAVVRTGGVGNRLGSGGGGDRRVDAPLQRPRPHRVDAQDHGERARRGPSRHVPHRGWPSHRRL